MTSPLRIAIIHYHLRGGGVTRVIQHARTGLPQDLCRVCVLTGEAPPPGSADFQRPVVVPALAYGAEAPGPQLAALLLEAATARLGGEPDVWHVHNPTLGKNPRLPAALHRMASQGRRLLLHIHDFPEDGRPALFRDLLHHVGSDDLAQLGRVLYPQARHVHYALLNRRDHELLAAAGVPPERLHLLPDPVLLDRAVPERAARADPRHGARLFLYPTRAIRRKNLGEFLLLSMLAEAGDRFAVTLSPRNPAQRAGYERWTRTARELGLPVAFEYAARTGDALPDLLTAASAAVTTSVGEGFGLAFLEPWTVGCPVAGRDLPELTRDFRDAGMQLAALYPSLPIPAAWLDHDGFVGRLRRTRTQLLASYGRSASERDFAEVLAATGFPDRVDFGRLDEDDQARVLQRLAADSALRDELQAPPLSVPPPDSPAVAANRDVVSRAYSLQSHVHLLLNAYRRVAETDPAPSLDGLDVTRLLDFFLAPERFFLLKT